MLQENLFWGFWTRSDTNRAIQPQKMARGLKFRIEEEEGFYYLRSKNKGADPLQGYCCADLCLCFRICKKQVFSLRGSNEAGMLQLCTVKILKQLTYEMSRVLRKLAFCICISENKDTNQLRGNREADQRLCFRYIDRTIPLLSNSKISSL